MAAGALAEALDKLLFFLLPLRPLVPLPVAVVVAWPIITVVGWPNSLSPMRISPQDDDKSDDDNEEAAEEDDDEEEPNVAPEALEHNKAVDANDDKGEPVVNDEDKLAA